MVAKDDMPAISAFSEAFAAALDDFVGNLRVSPSRQAIADQAGRSRAFVSDQMRGLRPVDTDTLTAISDLIGTPPQMLVRHVLKRMPPEVLGIPGVLGPDDGGGTVHPLPSRPRSIPAPMKKASRKDPE